MKIIFCELDSLHNKLACQPIGFNNKDECLENIENELMHSPIALPHPLKVGQFYVSRSGRNYSSIFDISSVSPKTFSNASEKIKKFVDSKLQRKWTTMGNYSTGYVLDKNNLPYMGVIATDNAKERLIALGTCGCLDQKFLDKESFTKSLKDMEILVNICIESWLFPFVNSGKLKLPKHYLYVRH